MRITKITVLTAALAIGLTGCTFSANFTVSADKVAELAASALEEQYPDLGRPELDCGDDSVDIVVGEQVDCVLTDPSNGAELDAVVTITEVDGTNYSIDVKVADVPNNPAPSNPSPSAEPETYTVPSSDLAELAAGALTEPLGYTPEITCEPADVPLVEGEQINCLATGNDGSTGTAVITITEVDGADYRIYTEIQ